MIEFGLCPNCFNKLTESSAIKTGLSEIFKGNNSYLLCKNCQQVLLYNMNRDMIFDLDDYKEDKEVIAEINKLLSEIDNHYEVAKQECSGDCDTCCSCISEPEPSYKRSSRAKPVPKCEEIEELIQEEQPDVKEVITSTLNSGLLAVNVKDPTVKLILVNTSDLDDLNLNEWVFFEMTPVEVKVKKIYDIVRS